MADVLSQIPGLAGYLAMENQRRQAAMADLKGVSGLASLLQQQRQAALEEQMAPLKMQAMQAQVAQQRMQAEDAQRRRAFFSPENFQQFMNPGRPAVAPGQGVTGGMDEGGLGQILGAGPTEQGAPAASAGTRPSLDIDRMIASGVSQGVLNPEAIINRQTQIEQRIAKREARRQEQAEKFAQENRTLAEKQAFAAQQQRQRAEDQEYLLRVAASLRPAPQPRQDPLVQVEMPDPNNPGKKVVRYVPQSLAAGMSPPMSASEARAQRENQKQQFRDEGVKSRLNLVIDKVDEALKNTSMWTAGMVGGITSKIPGTPAYDLERTVDTIKANIGFQELQAMRDASPTGGALGQVAVKELDMLQATLASIDAGQSPTQLRSNLEKIKTHYQNWLKAVEQSSRQDSGQPTAAAPAAGSDKFTVGKTYTDSSGRKAKYLGNGKWEEAK